MVLGMSCMWSTSWHEHGIMSLRFIFSYVLTQIHNVFALFLMYINLFSSIGVLLVKMQLVDCICLWLAIS